MNFLNLSLDDVYWRAKYGKSYRKLSPIELRSNLNDYVKNPVFFLSTGRCGTKWFSDLFETNKKLMVLHSPSPTLAVQSRKAYEYFITKGVQNSDLLQEVFLTGREEYLRYAYKTGKRIIETNNYVTFFAPILLNLFPDAKFVHLIRHPGEFIRSGMRRKYYEEQNFDDIKRIIPINDINKKWGNYSRIEKIAWLWNETNNFIEDFKMKNSTACYSYNFNENSLNNILGLIEFLKIDLDNYNVSKLMKSKANVQILGDFPRYKDWPNSDKQAVNNICKGLANSYNYEL